MALFPPSPPPTPPLIFIGYGYGVPPQTPYTFADPVSLTQALRGGPCSGFVQFMFNPSPQLFGAQLVTYINVGENTQSSLALNNAAPSGVATLKSTNYGVPSNLLQAEVQTGTLAGKKVTLFDNYSNAQIIGDNLGVPFQLAYTGSASAGVSFSVVTSGLNATSFSVTSPNSGESFTVPIGAGQYNTVTQIVEYLNGTGYYSAAAIGDGSLPASYLDSGQTTVSLTPPVSSQYQFSNVTAALGAVIYWVNQYAASANFATATVSGTIASYTSGLAPANIGLTSFSGARSIPPTNSDYTTAFNLALGIPGWAVFADSNTQAVMSLGTSHAETASQPINGKWRRFYTGSNVGDSVATTVNNAISQNSNRTVYMYPGVWRVDTTTGINTLFGGLYAAAAAAGMDSGNIVATPLTNKVLNGNGVEVALTVAQINQLQQAGVMVIKGTTPPSVGTVNYNNVPPTIVSDLTTWQQDNNPENVFDQQIKCRDYLAYSMVNAAQPYVGTIADPYDETRILNAAKATLNALIYTPGSNGVLSSWNASSLLLNYNGTTQTAAISASVVLVGQNRFITETVTIFPLNLSISAASLTPSQ